tara:strand:- start:71392 stop:72366 length:975 start_codon:yes stop_codon:yes gene_type:complete
MSFDELLKLSPDQIKDIARKDICADLIDQTKTEAGKQELLKTIRSAPDDEIKMMATISNIPEKHHNIFLNIVKGESNEFQKELDNLEYLLETGDILLIQGESISSKALSTLQKITYKGAKSSHVAIVHAEFMCIDAIPKIGVRHVTIPNLLPKDLSRFRVMRLKTLTDEEQKKIMSLAGFYLEQPYKISPLKKQSKKFSYCSELARKIYTKGNVQNTAIPSNTIVSPADFDRILNSSDKWLDITDLVKPFIVFCMNYKEIIENISLQITTGFKLNKKRYNERREFLETLEKNSEISLEKKEKIRKQFKTMEDKLHHKFWDNNSL